MQTCEEVRKMVGEWSRKNFGGQETPYLKCYNAGDIRPGEKRNKEAKPGNLSTMPRVVALEGLAPLMGIVEEVGELFAGVAASKPADMRDALGDIAVYLCDYLTREGLVWPAYRPAVPGVTVAPLNDMVAALGKIYHCHLKRHQRIRDMHEEGAFNELRGEAVRAFVWHLERVCREIAGTDTTTLLNETWHNIVSKRDWKKDAAAGGGATHKNIEKTAGQAGREMSGADETVANAPAVVA